MIHRHTLGTDTDLNAGHIRAISGRTTVRFLWVLVKISSIPEYDLFQRTTKRKCKLIISWRYIDRQHLSDTRTKIEQFIVRPTSYLVIDIACPSLQQSLNEKNYRSDLEKIRIGFRIENGCSLTGS